jgi:hypothetical protein|tara:strand:+ start:1050 stop:1313 length:264 start_codon:yes stop_codon:yes gene_type:complete
MRSYIYKTIIFCAAIVIVFEFTIGRKFNQVTEKFDRFLTKEGRKEAISSLKKEIKKANDKENYLDEDERVLFRDFILKIKKELDLNN